MDLPNHTISLHSKTYDIHYGSEPIILNFSHSGRLYPDHYLKSINTTPEALRIFEDPYLDVLLTDKTQCDTSTLINHCARVFIDVNRSLHQNPSEPMLNGEAMGLIPVSFPCGNPLYTHRLNRHDIHTRIDTYYKPYHKALEALISRHKQKFQKVIVLDCHSMPSHGDSLDPDAFKARPDMIIGDNFGTSSSQEIVQIIEKSFVNMGLSVFRNFPYAGGYVVKHYGSIKNDIHVIQIEINRRLYVNSQTLHLTENAQRLKKQFQIMLQDLKLFML